MERRNALRRCERLGLSLCAVPSLNGTVCLSIWKGQDHGKGLGKGYGGRGRKECGKTENIRKDGVSAERRNRIKH